MNGKYTQYQAGVFVIAVTSCRNGVFSGEFCYPNGGEAGVFSGLLELILKMDSRLDEENTPQAFHRIRSFYPPQLLWQQSRDNRKPGKEKLASFTVHVLFRRNATWQGTVRWIEENQTQHFRSVLELACLISSAVLTRKMSLQFSEQPDCLLEAAE